MAYVVGAGAADTVGSSGGHVLFQPTGHGLVDNDVIYVKSSVEQYNGFWYVDQIDANTFKIREYPTAAHVPFIKSVLLEYFVVGADLKWHCIHLPIIYKLSNTRWPTNSVDTARSISSVTDQDGYCEIVASGNMTAAVATIQPLEFVKITGSTDEELNGVWQVLSVTDDTTFVINIPFSAANDTALTGATVHFEYNNYHVKVQVWGGLNNGHVYYAQEPYELLATLDLIPDENGICMFSIHEILKKQIAIKNNLLLGTLPNNLDAFTMFFIKYAEVYDNSDGAELTQVVPSYTSDISTFQGRAINAMLPFKNVYAGAMSEYVTGKFLTLFTRPTIFSGKYFDLSYIFEGTAPIVRQEYYLNGMFQSAAEITEDDAGVGVYRTQLTDPPCAYDRVDVKVISDASGSEVLTNPSFAAALTPWSNEAGAGENWAWDASNSAEVTLPGGGGTSDNLIQVIGNTAAGDYIIEYQITPVAPNVVFIVEAFDNGVLTQQLINTTIISSALGTYSEIVTIAAIFDTIKIRVSHASSSPEIQLHSFSLTPRVVTALSETKTIDIDCDCLKSKSTGFPLSWLNPLGGFDHWYFTPYADHGIEILDSGETEENVFPEWPNSYGEFADTIRKQTHRTSRRQVVIRSQGVTVEKLQGIEYIKTSPLVQIVNSIYDRRTVLVDSDSFTSYREGQSELYTITFTISYTDDVPSQKV